MDKKIPFFPPSPRVSRDLQKNNQLNSSLFLKIEEFFHLLDDQNANILYKDNVSQKLLHCFQTIVHPKYRNKCRTLVKRQLQWLYPNNQNTLTKEQFFSCYRQALAARIECEILEIDIIRGIQSLKQYPYKDYFQSLDLILNYMVVNGEIVTQNEIIQISHPIIFDLLQQIFKKPLDDYKNNVADLKVIQEIGENIKIDNTQNNIKVNHMIEWCIMLLEDDQYDNEALFDDLQQAIDLYQNYKIDQPVLNDLNKEPETGNIKDLPNFI